ncbi:MAG: creatininase family protein [Planctomycetes bacterium]|nr:creatininase family protein [Planctomycetota bacterium]
MHDLALRTTPEAKSLLAPRTIALLPIGSTEPHGPHLPLDTDVTIALAQSNRAAQKLEELGTRAVVLPPIAYGVTNYTQGFAGRITLRPGTLWALVEDVINALEQEGVRQIVLVNGHLEPAHVQVLRGVVLDHAERTEQRAQAVFADVTRRRFAERLGEEFVSGDCHAGRYETSIVLHAAPDTVRRPLLPSLAPVRIDLISKMKSGVTTFVEAGAGEAYCGDPRAASAEEGRELVDSLAGIVVDLARETWPDLFGG